MILVRPRNPQVHEACKDSIHPEQEYHFFLVSNLANQSTNQTKKTELCDPIKKTWSKGASQAEGCEMLWEKDLRLVCMSRGGKERKKKQEARRKKRVEEREEEEKDEEGEGARGKMERYLLAAKL